MALLAWGLQSLGALEPLERRVLDLLFLARGPRLLAAPIVIVGIDHESLQRVPHRWPWPRRVHARLVQELAAAGASVIAFDVLFVDEDPEDDEVLAAAAEAAGNVVWASSVGTADQPGFAVTWTQEPVARLRVASSASGFADLVLDPDGRVRRLLPFRPLGSRVLASFAGTVATRHRGSPVPPTMAGSLLIDYVGPPGSVPTVPYIGVLEGRVPRAAFRDRIVLVGAVASGTDGFFTPFHSRALPETRRLMPGVEIHAQLIDMFLDGRVLARVGAPSMLALFAGLGLAAVLVVGQWPPLAAGAALGAAGLACLGLALAGFSWLGVWIPVAGPLVGASVTWGVLAFQGYARERAEKAFIRGALDRYVGEEIVAEVIERGLDVALGGRRQSITVLFADLRGFTGLSERVPPETVVQVLNEHFTAAAEIVFRHGGTLDKFIGDALMAFWNAPAPRDDHALRAVRAALEMQAAANAIDARLREWLGERWRLGIGICTGEAVVGHIGSPRRLGYTAVGDPVNLAARVEALTREHEAAVLITQSTHDLVTFAIETEAMGPVSVRGRREPVMLYRVVGPRPARPAVS